MLKIILDTTSEYMMDLEAYPREVCNVMVDIVDEAQVDLLEKFFIHMEGEKPEYLDIYAYIDPETKTVNRLLVKGVYNMGRSIPLSFDVIEPADRIRYYLEFEETGGEIFKSFIKDSLACLREQQAENVIRLIRSNSILFEKCGIYSDMMIGGALAGIIRTPESKIKERLNALFQYAGKYINEIDELDFYVSLADEFTEDELRLCDNREAVASAISYMDEHGLL